MQLQSSLHGNCIISGHGHPLLPASGPGARHLTCCPTRHSARVRATCGQAVAQADLLVRSVQVHIHKLCAQGKTSNLVVGLLETAVHRCRERRAFRQVMHSMQVTS